jgi:hypothetical protein
MQMLLRLQRGEGAAKNWLGEIQSSPDVFGMNVS